MRHIFMGLALALACHISTARADELLYSYDGDAFPWDAGWSGDDTRCEPPCHESIEDGHFVLRFINGGDLVQYSRIVALPGVTPPPSLWVEWNFRSNTRFSGAYGCDAGIQIYYREMHQLVELYGDGAMSFDGIDHVLGLNPAEFHTYRFESADGVNFTIAVDGLVFISRGNNGGTNASFIDMRGAGTCLGDQIDEWDFVRYGTVSSGEQLLAIDPPPGILAAAEGAQFRILTLTFDRPTYLYRDEITVTTTGGTPPGIRATKRFDNGAPEVLRVVLATSLPPGETTTFTFDTGAGPQSISYFREQPEIPAASGWSVAAATLIALSVGRAVFGSDAPATL